MQQDPKLDRLASYMLNRIAHRYNRNVQARFRAAGLTVLKSRVLVSIMTQGPLTIGELCVFAVAEQPTISRAVDRMEIEGLITRQLIEDDLRKRRVDLTDHGRRMAELIWPEMECANDEMMADLSDEERQQLLGLLGKVLKVIRKNPI